MGQIIQKNQPCLKCPSSDARQVYVDGSSYCFSCSTYFKSEGEQHITDTPKKDDSARLSEIESYTSRGFKDRNIEKLVSEFYGVKVSYNEQGEIDTHYYPYKDGTKIGYKVRKLPKIFSTVGQLTPLFGKDKFSGAGKRLVITEGELDALSVAQAYYDKWQKIYPVVSLTSSTGVNKLLECRDWIRSFQEVIICFDNDEAGEKAKQQAIKIIGIDKIKIVTMPSECKDASDILVKFGSERVLQTIWDAAPWVPAGIIGKEELWKALEAYNNIKAFPYPSCLSGVNSKIKGMRFGEITLFISGTGSGKSTIIRETELHVLENTSDKIGVISLEESPAEHAKKLSGMILNRNPEHEDISLEELKVGFDKVFDSDRVILLDHQGSIKDSSIIDQLEYMCLVGCKYLFIDHITILVSEGADNLTGNEAVDKIMNDLLRLVKRHDVWVGLVSHLRKVHVGGRAFEEGRLPSLDDIRGSGSIKQVCFDIIAFARNMVSADEKIRNSIIMSVLKSRTVGLTGPVPGAYYTHATGRLKSLEEMPDEDFTIA